MLRLVPAVPVALLLVSAVACGTGQPTTEQAAAPALSNAAAADVVAAYDQANNGVNATLDPAGLPDIETRPLRTSSESWLRITKAHNETVPLITSSDTRYVVPSNASWFVATSNRARGGVPTPRPVQVVHVLEDGKWRAAYSLTPLDDVPSPAVNAASAATAVTDFSDLSMRPEEVGKEILDHYVTGRAGTDFLRSAALDDQLANGFAVGRQVLKTKGRSLDRSLGTTTHPVFAVRTTDGGVLAFTAATVVDVITATDPGAVVTLDPKSNEGALLADRPISAPRFEVIRLQTYLTYLPARTSGAQARVLAYSDTPISVR